MKPYIPTVVLFGVASGVLCSANRLILGERVRPQTRTGRTLMKRPFLNWALAPLARWLSVQDADNRFYSWLYSIVKRLRWGL